MLDEGLKVTCDSLLTSCGRVKKSFKTRIGPIYIIMGCFSLILKLRLYRPLQTDTLFLFNMRGLNCVLMFLVSIKHTGVRLTLKCCVPKKMSSKTLSSPEDGPKSLHQILIWIFLVFTLIHLLQSIRISTKQANLDNQRWAKLAACFYHPRKTALLSTNGQRDIETLNALISKPSLPQSLPFCLMRK